MTIRRTLHQIGVHGCHPRRKPLLKTIHKKASKQFSDAVCTLQQRTWITGTMSYGLMRWRLICLVLMASSMCGGDQKRSTKISVSCLQSSMVVGMSWSKAAWVLQVLESYISRETWTPTCTEKILQQSMIPSLQKLGRRAVSQHDNDSKHTSNTTIAFLKRLNLKLAKRVSWLEPNRRSLGGSSSRRWRCAKSQTSASSVTSSWRSGRAF